MPEEKEDAPDGATEKDGAGADKLPETREAKATPKEAASGGGEDDDPLDAIVKLMQEQKLDKAVVEMQKMLKKKPDDPVLLHNLGVVLTEQGRWVEAEDTFMQAYEAQKKSGKYNYATLFGLATVLTEQGGTGKLLQAEALFRDCLDRAVAQEEHGIFETYRAFTSLAENLGLQKRWGEAAQAYEQAFDMGKRMFGESHERNLAQAALLDRARRLARLQTYMRYFLWTATAAIPVAVVWLWYYVGGPSIREMIGFPAVVNATDISDISALGEGQAAMAVHGGEL